MKKWLNLGFSLSLIISFCVFGYSHIAKSETKAEFSFADVVSKAKQLSLSPYVDNKADLPASLTQMKYEQYSDIRFRPEQALWHDKNFSYEAQFYHLGGLFNHPVQLHEIKKGKVIDINYDFHNFDFGKNNITPETFDKNLGYAGFRLQYPLNTDFYDELISFLGASYFRSMAKGQRYGLSARGLGINTAEKMPEEFPIFKEFWLNRPDDEEIKVYALLDSPSVAGAYSFNIIPGEETIIDVEAVLYPRMNISKLEIAPLTSMFLYGENTKIRFDDYRPEVHDSDGLLVVNGNGEKIWRPLDNSEHLRLSSFLDNNPKGFGLMQRDRNPRHYLDPEAAYDLRPSLWIEPLENWGKGMVQLAELPSIDETNDNVVAYWVPDMPIEAQQEYRFKYRMHWVDEAPVMTNLAKIYATYNGMGGDGLAGEYLRHKRKYVIDFVDFDVENLKQEIENGNIWADISNQAGTITNVKLMYTPSINGATLYFDFEPNKEIIELRVLLRDKAHDNRPISEIWSYQWWK